MREWLHHRALADRAPGFLDRQRRASRLQFLRVFLDGFWWWGCYVEFPFCTTLLEDWESTQQDVGWLEDVRLILNRYPTGWRKDEAEPGVWADVRSALIAAREACGLSGRAGSLRTEDERHVRGLIDLFLAHASRYRRPIDEAERARLYVDAVRYYGEALLLFEADEDRWDGAWTLFERAELHGEHGAEDEALEDWNAAVTIVRDEEMDDQELAANLHRTIADIEARRGNAAESLAAMGRAVARAYLFQNRPHPPDVYTQRFYEELLERMGMLLRSLWSEADERALEPLLATPLLATREQDRLSPAAVRATGPEAVLGLLPRAPHDDELGLEKSPFLTEWTELFERIGEDASEDLERR
jgi:hypothetical protein